MYITFFKRTEFVHDIFWSGPNSRVFFFFLSHRARRYTTTHLHSRYFYRRLKIISVCNVQKNPFSSVFSVNETHSYCVIVIAKFTHIGLYLAAFCKTIPLPKSKHIPHCCTTEYVQGIRSTAREPNQPYTRILKWPAES